MHRVSDGLLGRTVAMKVLRPELGDDRDERTRFMREASVTAQLPHPGVVSVLDRGHLADGRPWYTMPEICGHSFDALFAQLHGDVRCGRWGVDPEHVSFRRLVDALARVAQAVGFAHQRGIIHRDLKPANLMIGSFGEVLIVDWGLARAIGGDDAPTGFTRPSDWARDPEQTDVGVMVGTLPYMAPEQLRGHHARVGPHSDVFALGVILYELMFGRPPFDVETQLQVAVGAPVVLPSGAAPDRPVPPEPLRRACEQALQADPEARPSTAEAFAQGLTDWLDGRERRGRALTMLSESDVALARLTAAQAAYTDHRTGASDAHRLALDLARLQSTYIGTLQGALQLDPECVEARNALAVFARTRADAAAAIGDHSESTRFEGLVRSCARPEDADWLEGLAQISVQTEPSGAQVELWEPAHPGWKALGATPVRTTLPHGSHLLRLSHPQRATVPLPVNLGRLEAWTPSSSTGEARAVRLPEVRELPADTCVVAAGWFVAGGDDRAVDALPRRRVWLDTFAIRRHPVTHAEYLAFVNDLVADGRLDEAQTRVPGDPIVGSSSGAGSLYRRASDGTYRLHETLADGTALRPDHPVVLVDLHSCRAFARWLSARTGVRWRLPTSCEWEKAARGVDGRAFAWGEPFDPSLANTSLSLPTPGVQPVGAFPGDESPYGMRGATGNVRDWCCSVWRPEGAVDGDLDRGPEDTGELWVVRGGSWNSRSAYCRLAGRFADRAGDRLRSIGFRLVCPVRGSRGRESRCGSRGA